MLFKQARHDKSENTSSDVAQFWGSMERLLEIEDEKDEAVVNSELVSYVKKASDNYKEYLHTEQDIYRLALILTQSKLFQNNREFCLSKLLSLLSVDLLETNLKFIISYIILCASKSDSSLLEILLQFQGFTVIYNNLYNHFAYLSRYGEERFLSNKVTEEQSDLTDIEFEIIEGLKQISTVLMGILFQIFKYSKCDIGNIGIVDDFFVYFLMKSIRSDTTDDIFNNTKFKLLLALNEQYMIFSYQYEVENKVYKYLINNSVSKNFMELLLLMFNRVTDRSLQIMMCKIIYLILTSDEDLARDFFYLNDLHVFVDVLLRELKDISEDEELIRNTFLRVLFPLLKNTELINSHYRRSDLVEVLEYLSSLDNICSTEEIKREHKTTSRLALKCLNQVEWLQYSKPEGSDKESSEGSRRSSVSIGSIPSQRGYLDKRAQHLYMNNQSSLSAESITKRLQAPPPPPARKAPSRVGSGQKVAQFKPN
ncbi:LAFE_0B03092g1_1 [Lachancea fermentati]|uniref:LAFE_0B03092g1_1 n=1 Tax=Lachancea fermentati TaxID=4955 RepID=A0A1G4M7M9_LACFM|nr:LAFE_0B03092g1_1 [Lachancea fermentati]